LLPYEKEQMAAGTSRMNQMLPYELQQLAAQTGKTGAETQRLTSLLPHEMEQMSEQTKQMAAQTRLTDQQINKISTLLPYEAEAIGAQTGMTNAQISRLQAMTPAEIDSIYAGINLTGSQAKNFESKTLSEFGMTPTGLANIFSSYAQGQASLINANANMMEAGGQQTMVTNTPFGTQTTTTPTSSYFSPVSSYPYSGGAYTTTPTSAERGKMYTTSSGAKTYMNPSLWASGSTKNVGGNDIYFGPSTMLINPYSGGAYTTTQILPPPPPRKDINVGLGGRTYTANFGSYGGYPVTGKYNQRSGKENKDRKSVV
jgi:hypothetical protein